LSKGAPNLQGPQTKVQAPFTHCSWAQVLLLHCWHARIPAQSALEVQTGGLGGTVPPPLPPPVPGPPPVLPPPPPPVPPPGGLHELPQVPLMQPLCAQVPSGHSWHSIVCGPQSTSVLQVDGGGRGGFGALHWRTQAPATHAVPAQLPSAQTWQTSGMTQSAATLHSGGGGGCDGQVCWQVPLTQAIAAQVPLLHCGHAPTAGQSRSLPHAPGLVPPPPPPVELHTSAHWPFTQSVSAQLPSAH
jgi:hypothetical protein